MRKQRRETPSPSPKAKQYQTYPKYTPYVILGNNFNNEYMDTSMIIPCLNHSKMMI